MHGRMAILLKNVNGETEAEAFRIPNYKTVDDLLPCHGHVTMPRFDQKVVGISYLQRVIFSIGTPIPSANNSSCYCVLDETSRKTLKLAMTPGLQV